eukprot:Hpha_TRINITY_DN15687_c5_g11::TRINITY_DN15687_c5_g11_i1::g.99143::m.99143
MTDVLQAGGALRGARATSHPKVGGEVSSLYWPDSTPASSDDSPWVMRHRLFVLISLMVFMYLLFSAAMAILRKRVRLRKGKQTNVAANLVRLLTELPLWAVLPPYAHGMLFGSDQSDNTFAPLDTVVLALSALYVFELLVKTPPKTRVGTFLSSGHRIAVAAGGIYITEFLDREEHAGRKLVVPLLLGALSVGWLSAVVTILYQASWRQPDRFRWVSTVLLLTAVVTVMVNFVQHAVWILCYLKWLDDIKHYRDRVMLPIIYIVVAPVQLHNALVFLQMRRRVLGELSRRSDSRGGSSSRMRDSSGATRSRRRQSPQVSPPPTSPIPSDEGDEGTGLLGDRPDLAPRSPHRVIPPREEGAPVAVPVGIRGGFSRDRPPPAVEPLQPDGRDRPPSRGVDPRLSNPAITESDPSLSDALLNSTVHYLSGTRTHPPPSAVPLPSRALLLEDSKAATSTPVPTPTV